MPDSYSNLNSILTPTTSQSEVVGKKLNLSSEEPKRVSPLKQRNIQLKEDNIPYMDSTPKTPGLSASMVANKGSAASTSSLLSAATPVSSSDSEKVEEDLPRYSVQLKSRFSPIKKPSQPVLKSSLASSSPKQQVSFSLPKSVQFITASVPPPAPKIQEPVVPNIVNTGAPVSIASIMKKVAVPEEHEVIKTVVDVPRSVSVKNRIQEMHKIMKANSDIEPPSPAPEILPVNAKKRLFERKIREETQGKEQVIARSEYLLRRKQNSSSNMQPPPQPSHAIRDSVANIEKGIVHKMQQRVSPSVVKRKDQDNECETPKDVAEAMRGFDAINDMSCGAVGGDVLSPTDKQYFEAQPCYTSATTSSDMDTDSQTSIDDDRSSYSKRSSSPSQNSQSSQDDLEDVQYEDEDRMYPVLPDPEDADLVHTSPLKKSRYSSKKLLNSADDDACVGAVAAHDYDYKGLSDARTPSKISLGIEKDLLAHMEKVATPMVRSLSQYRREKLSEAKEAERVPQVVFGVKKKDPVVDEMADHKRRQLIRMRITSLKTDTLPKFEAGISQASQAVTLILSQPAFINTLQHAEAERHLLDMRKSLNPWNHF